MALLAVVSMPTQSKTLMVKQRFIGLIPHRSNLSVNCKAVRQVDSANHVNELAVRFSPQYDSIRSDLYDCTCAWRTPCVNQGQSVNRHVIYCQPIESFL